MEDSSHTNSSSTPEKASSSSTPEKKEYSSTRISPPKTPSTPPRAESGNEEAATETMADLRAQLEIARLRLELANLKTEKAAPTPAVGGGSAAEIPPPSLTQHLYQSSSTTSSQQHPADQAVLPIEKSSRQRQKQQNKASGGGGACKSFFRAFSLAVVAVCFYLLFLQYTAIPVEPVKARPIAITNYFPSTKCLELSAEDVKLLVTSLEWPHIEYSLREHIHSLSLDSVSAFRIGKQYCFIMLRAPGNTTIDMFNPRITAISPKDTVSLSERTVNCPERTMHPVRSVRIAVDYLDSATLQPMHAIFNGTQAYAMQAEFAYSHGKSICDNSDSGIETLLSIMNQGLKTISTLNCFEDPRNPLCI